MTQRIRGIRIVGEEGIRRVRRGQEVALLSGEALPGAAWVDLDELLLHALLRLLPKGVVESGEDDEEPEARVGTLCRHRCEVGGLAALDVPEDEAPGLEALLAWRIKQADHFGTGTVYRVDNGRVPTLLDQIPPQGRPVGVFVVWPGVPVLSLMASEGGWSLQFRDPLDAIVVLSEGLFNEVLGEATLEQVVCGLPG